VLVEAAARVRRYTGLAHLAKHNRPLIVVVTKWDSWLQLLPDRDGRNPWVKQEPIAALDRTRIDERSQQVRELLLKTTPELVAAAESFAHSVTYVPVSALGRKPEADPRTGNLAVRPGEIRPVWATVPLLVGLYRAVPGLIPGVVRKSAAAQQAAETTVQLDGG
jgi:hypothetical protein